jgi:hypothetical protein
VLRDGSSKQLMASLHAFFVAFALCRPGAHFIVRECAGQVNRLLSSLVLGPQHLHSIVNTHYLDPSPAVQLMWSQGAGGNAQASQQDGSSGSNSSRGSKREAVYATVTTGSLDLGKLK